MPNSTDQKGQTPRPTRNALERLLLVLDLSEETLRTMPEDEAMDAIKPYQDEIPRLIELTGLQDTSSSGPIGGRYEGLDDKGKQSYTFEPYTDPKTGVEYGDPSVPWLLVRISRWKQVVKQALEKLDSSLTADNDEDAYKNVLTYEAKKLWDALEGRVLTSKELAKELFSKPDAVRQLVKKLNEKDHKVKNMPSRGYYRPDSPPPEFTSAT